MKDKYVILINNSVQSKGPVPSGLMLEGSAHLAGRLLSEGYVPLVLDFNTVSSVKSIALNGKAGFLEETIDNIHGHIQKTGAKMVGFTLYTNGFKDNIYIAQELKERNPGLIVAGGGPNVSYFEEEIFSYTNVFDVLVTGKADNSIGALAAAVYNDISFGGIPGAIYRTNTRVVKNKRKPFSITTLPFPSYDPGVYPSVKNGDKILVSTSRSSNGCRYGRCSFCIQSWIDGKYRERYIENFLAEIAFLGSEYGIKNFREASPNPSPKQLKKLFASLPSDVKISCFAYSDQEYDFSIAKNNLVGLFLGVESMDPKTLLALRKTKNPETYIKQCKSMITEAKKHDIATIDANIVPTANDTTERIQRDLEAVLRLQPDFITALPLAPMPNTPLYRRAIKKGDRTGVRLNKNFLKELMLTELDLLKPSEEKWPDPPFQLKVDDKFEINPFEITAEKFIKPLSRHGIEMASDEVVLMAYLYHNGLAKDQQKRREQVNSFQKNIRQTIDEGNYKELKRMIKQINGS